MARVVSLKMMLAVLVAGIAVGVPFHRELAVRRLISASVAVR